MDKIKDIDWYIDRAKLEQGFSSDRKLDAELGYSGNFISYLRKRKSLPSEDKMVELAMLAKVDPAVALIHLRIWNTQGAAQKTYKDILQNLSKATLAVLAGGVIMSTPAGASPSLSETEGCKVRDNITYVIKTKSCFNE